MTKTKVPIAAININFFETSGEKIDGKKPCRFQCWPHEAIRAAGADVFELQHRKLRGKREAWAVLGFPQAFARRVI